VVPTCPSCGAPQKKATAAAKDGWDVRMLRFTLVAFGLTATGWSALVGWRWLTILLLVVASFMLPALFVEHMCVAHGRRKLDSGEREPKRTGKSRLRCPCQRGVYRDGTASPLSS